LQEAVFAAQMAELWLPVYQRPLNGSGGDDTLEVEAIAIPFDAPLREAAVSEVATSVSDAVRAVRWIEEGDELCMHLVAVNSWTAPLHLQLILHLATLSRCAGCRSVGRLGSNSDLHGRIRCAVGRQQIDV
jgi:hypothetical protein